MEPSELLRAAQSKGVTADLLRKAYAHGQANGYNPEIAAEDERETEAHTWGIEAVFCLLSDRAVEGDWTQETVNDLICLIGA